MLPDFRRNNKEIDDTHLTANSILLKAIVNGSIS